MSSVPPDTTSSERRPARVPGLDGWIKPKHGKGMLRPWQKGNSGFPGKPSRYTETQQLARAHSLEAVQALIERLKDPDGRIVVVAANSLLERAWGKVREAKPEDNAQAQVDLSQLTAQELAIMVKLAESGRLRPASSDGEGETIEAEAEPVSGK